MYLKPVALILCMYAASKNLHAAQMKTQAQAIPCARGRSQSVNVISHISKTDFAIFLQQIKQLGSSLPLIEQYGQRALGVVNEHGEHTHAIRSLIKLGQQHSFGSMYYMVELRSVGKAVEALLQQTELKRVLEEKKVASPTSPIDKGQLKEREASKASTDSDVSEDNRMIDDNELIFAFDDDNTFTNKRHK